MITREGMSDFAERIAFDTIIEAIPSLLCTAEDAGIIVYVNSALERLFGYSKAELLEKPVEILVPERFRAIHVSHRVSFNSKPSTRAMGVGRNLYGRRKDGSEFPLELTLIPKDTERGKFVFATLMDVTERKESEEKFELILKSSPNAVVMVDEEGKIVLVNPKAEKLFDYSSSDLVGKLVEVLIPERFRKSHVAYRSGFISHMEIRPMGAGRDLYGLRSDGTEMPIEIGLAPIKTHHGAFVLSTIIDISVRKEIENRLKNYQHNLEALVEAKASEIKRTNSFLDSIIENIPNMIFLKDAKDLKFVRFNKAGEDLLGYLREALVGKNDYDFFSKSEADFFTTKDRAVFEGRKILDIPEEPIHTRFKGKRILHTRKIPMFDEHGKPEYLLGISEDITEKKQAEETRLQLLQSEIAKEEAQKAVRLRDDFISIASHELRTPLTALKMQFQMIPKILKNVEFSGRDKFFELFHNSLRQLDQFTRLVDELLDISRIGAGRLTLDVERVDLSVVVSQVIKHYESNLLKTTGGEVNLKLDNTIQGQWDPTRIEQIVVNLLTNAMKYGSGKPIEISTQIEGGKAIIMVRDHGIGIAKEDQSKIFERFERAVSITKFGGLGLGLYITRQIVQAHGGMIRVESELGQGSTFIVELPLIHHSL